MNRYVSVRRFIKPAVLMAVIVTVISCETYYFRSNYTDVNTFLHDAAARDSIPYLKAHLKNGDVCILRNQWVIDSAQTQLSGTGIRYDFNRNVIHSGAMRIGVDSIAILETNRKLDGAGNERVAALAILAGIDAAVTLACIANPKACFGSCPTFYLDPNQTIHFADAEGFTHAVIPSLEYDDIDALNASAMAASDVFLTMKNEAMETHCVKSVALAACPREKGQRIYHTRDDRFYSCENRYPLSSARAQEGDITPRIRDGDRIERFSLADTRDLCSKETVYLSFNNITDTESLGLVMSYRQTMMSTYLFYSAMDYMGNEVGDGFALLETDPKLRSRFDTAARILGGIDVYLWDENQDTWLLHGSFDESGPIALNHQILPLMLEHAGSELKLKLVMNKGLWRIDQVALTNIRREVEPVILQPYALAQQNTGHPDALGTILAEDAYLVTSPGNAYTFVFRLPEGAKEYDLFLRSEGYYLEWMRASWLADKNLAKLWQMVDHPRSYLRGETAAYKEYEETMERMFWNSRIDTRAYSYVDHR